MFLKTSVRLEGLLAAALVLASAMGCGKAQSDAQISEATQVKLDTVLPGQSKGIQVQVANAVVVLNGSVNTDADRSAAGDAAHQVAGVKAVLNNLTVTPDPGVATAASLPQGDMPGTAQVGTTNISAVTRASSGTDGSTVLASDTARLPTKPTAGRVKGRVRSGGDTGETIAPDKVIRSTASVSVPTKIDDSEPMTVSPRHNLREVTIPPSTSLFVRLGEGLNSAQNQPGQFFQATVARPVVINNEVVIPQDADVEGRIVDARKGKRFVGKSDLVIELASLSFGGRTYQVQTDQWSKTTGGGKATAAKTGIGAGTGAGIGLVAGGAVGSAIGAGAGAGGGVVWSALTGGRPVKLAAETQIEFHLTSPVSIAPPIPGTYQKRPVLAAPIKKERSLLTR